MLAHAFLGAKRSLRITLSVQAILCNKFNKLIILVDTNKGLPRSFDHETHENREQNIKTAKNTSYTAKNAKTAITACNTTKTSVLLGIKRREEIIINRVK